MYRFFVLLDFVEEDATDEFSALTAILIFSVDEVDRTCLGIAPRSCPFSVP